MKRSGSNTINFNMKGYDRVRAIYKLKQSINKFGDRLGRKNKLLNEIKRSDNIGNDFINLTINKVQPKNSRSTLFFNIFKKRSNDSVEKNKNDSYKEECKGKGYEFEFNENKNQNGNELLNNSYDIKFKETGLLSHSNRNSSNNYQNDFSDYRNQQKKLSFIKIKQNLKRNHIVNHKKCDNDIHYQSSLNKNISEINKKIFHKIEIHNNDKGSIYSAVNYNYITLVDKNKNAVKYRNLKLGTKPKMKIKYNIIKLGRHFSNYNINQSDINIKSRLLFYNKYKKKNVMKLTKIKISKSRMEKSKGEGERESCHTGGGYMREYMMKNLEHQNFHQNEENKAPITFNRHSFKKIPSYVRLPNISRISLPKNNLGASNDNGIKIDYCDKSNNFFYLKDEKNNSLNKIYMINPFIRNRIINNLI